MEREVLRRYDRQPIHTLPLLRRLFIAISTTFAAALPLDLYLAVRVSELFGRSALCRHTMQIKTSESRIQREQNDALMVVYLDQIYCLTLH